ncbi:MAG: DinB family protein [Bacteroidota bacterium]
MKDIINEITLQLKEVQEGKIWINSTFHKRLAEIDETTAFLRPHEQLHSIAEIISHLTLWRNEAILKIKTGKGSKTDDCEENWLSNDQLKNIGWNSIRSNYDNSLKELILLLKEKNDSFLSQKYYDTDFKGYYDYRFVINGMLHHDLYHLGQIGIILKFLKEE